MIGVGSRFGRITVIGQPLAPVKKAKARPGSEPEETAREPRWRIRCDCGTGTPVRCPCGTTVTGLGPDGELAEEPCYVGDWVVAESILVRLDDCGCTAAAVALASLPPARPCVAPGCHGTIPRLGAELVHPLAGALCVGHALAATRVPSCSAPRCARPVVLPGVTTLAGLLCQDHLVAAVVTPGPAVAVSCGPPRPPRNLCRCGRPGVTLTPGGTPCEQHRRPQPAPTAIEDPEAGIRDDAIALLSVELGATVVWGVLAERVYGDAVSSTPCPARRYPRAPSRSVDAEIDHALIRTARAGGWAVRTRITELLDEGGGATGEWAARLFAQRGAVPVLLELDVEWRTSWDGTRFRDAWFRVNRSGMPSRLGARQVTAVLKSVTATDPSSPATEGDPRAA